MHHVLTSKCHILGCVQTVVKRAEYRYLLYKQIIKRTQKITRFDPRLMTVEKASPGLVKRSAGISTPLFIVYLLSLVCFHRVLFEVVTLLHHFSGHILGLRM